MANEAVLIVQRTIPINMTVADGTGIEQGTVLKLADPLTASSSSADDDIVAGIAYNEKIASDGVTKLAVIRGPGDIIKMTASGAVTVGDPVGTEASGSTNAVHTQINIGNLSGAKTLGTALETAADTDTFLVELNIQRAPTA